MSNIFDLFKQIESSRPAPTGPPQWIIVGLGNPGAQYANTRHNAGFITIDAFAAKYGAQWKKHQFRAVCTDVECEGIRCLLMKPETFMNLSGQAVQEAMQFYHIDAAHTLVLYDDITLPVGGLRIRKKGSDGGHNGMKNIIYLSGADDFPRIRIGIGKKPHPEYPLADWVLSAFSREELDILAASAERVKEAIPLMLQGKADLAMSRYNGNPPAAEPQT